MREPFMTHSSNRRRHAPPGGIITLKAAFMMVALLGISACALDIGWIAMTKTQLQAAADSAALAGGTQLLPGLGPQATQASWQVYYYSSSMAVDYANRHRNGEKSQTYASFFQDLSFGNGYYDPALGGYRKNWGQTPYNMIGVTLHRDRDGGTAGDDSLGLLFARALGHERIGLSVKATAIIMPAGGVRIPPGSSQLANIMPFTIHTQEWGRFQRAQSHYANTLHRNPSLINSSYWDSVTNRPLYYDYTSSNSGSGSGGGTELRQVYFDALRYSASDQQVYAGSDGILEIDAYPRARVYPLGGNVAGNSGTIDYGDPSNSTSDLTRQIQYGLNAHDLSYYTNNELNFSTSDPLWADGDTGISSGMESALLAIKGQTRVIALFDQIQGQGDTAAYRLIGMAGVRVMDARLSGSTSSKYLHMQFAPTVLAGATPDLSGHIDGNTTVFTPLILIE